MAASRSAHIQIDDLVRLRIPGEVQISPDGKWVVFVDKRASLEKNRYFHALVLVDTDTGAVATLTAGEHSDTAPCWMPDSRTIVFVSDRGGQENLWRVQIHGGEAERLTDLAGSVRAPRVSPDGRRVVFLHAPKSAAQRALEAGRDHAGPQVRHLTRLGYKQDGHGFVDGAWTHMWLLDLARGRLRRLTAGACHDRDPVWSPTGRDLAFVSNRIPRADLHAQNSDIFVVRAAGGAPRQLTRARGPKHAPAWSPDGRSIAYVGHESYPDTVENLHVWVVPHRGGRPRDLMPAAEIMCSDVAIGDTKEVCAWSAPPVWSADGRRIFFLASHAGAVNVFAVPARGGTPVPRTQGRHEIAALSPSADGARWALLRVDATNPGDVYLARFAGAGRRAGAPAHRTAGARDLVVPGAAVDRLTRCSAAALRGRRLQPPREFRIRSSEGHDIHGWVLLARARQRRAPAVLMVHGGPYAMYGWTFFHEFQMLAAAGYHVFYTNLRGSAGYGRQFMRAIVGRWGFEDHRDLATVADWIESQPWVDRERIALAGGSYGGFLTNWAIGHTQRFRCAVSMRTVADMVSLYGTSDIGWTLHTEFEAHPWDAHERYWRTSPLAFAAHIRTPLLLLHADEDHRCPVYQAEELFVALQILGRDVEMVRFVGESHGMSRAGRPHNRLERLRRILDWFERKL